VLGIGHERRFEPEVIALRQLIAEGTLGTVLQIEANFSQDKFFALPKDNWRLSNAHAPVGPLTATGIHLVDLSIAVLGPCEQVWARLATLGSDFENGDTLAVMMAFASGANAMISAVLATPFEGRFAVYGNRGWVQMDREARGYHHDVQRDDGAQRAAEGHDAERRVQRSPRDRQAVLGQGGQETTGDEDDGAPADRDAGTPRHQEGLQGAQGTRLHAVAAGVQDQVARRHQTHGAWSTTRGKPRPVTTPTLSCTLSTTMEVQRGSAV
jgi:predicted dehydrogenase